MSHLPLVLLLIPAALHAAPVLLDPPVEFPPPNSPGALPAIRYLGQPARDGRIDLTATNGFFDRCFQAADPGPALPGDEGLIGTSFGHLEKGAQDHGTARWHLWLPQPGEIRARFHLTVPESEAGRAWTIRLGDQTRTLITAAAGPAQAQPQTLTFTPAEAGKLTFTIDCTARPPGPGALIHFITLEGTAIADAKLLRTRWRPGAEHQAFAAPESCRAPDTWVFETEAVTPASSYSPLTTPFGYFGTGFNGDGEIPPGGSFNFSMWLAGRGAPSAPPINKMPRILATGLPDAEFSHFSHEGTGVKLRNATAYPDGAARTIQALRVEFENELWTYYGYFYDESVSRWKLFAAGRQPDKRGRTPDPSHGLLRLTGSFCEIPGPPARERSGDLVRIIRRRGWFLDQDQIPHRAIMTEPRGGLATARGKLLRDLMEGRGIEYHDDHSYYMDDYQRDGWIALSTGGMERHLPLADPLHPAEVPRARPAPLPAYLQAYKLAQLYELPVTFGPAKAIEISDTRATIDYPLVKTGPNSTATLYYGPTDALTYPATEISGGSPALRDMFRPERTWRHVTARAPVRTGPNRFLLQELNPDTTYHFRLFVEHDEGKSWDLHSGSFRTIPSP